MKIKFLSLLLLICLPSWVFAEDQVIKSKKLALASNYEEEIDRLNLQTKEIQNLLARIEVLEHTVSHLQQRIELLDPAATSAATPAQSLRSAADNRSGDEASNKKDDIFDTPLKKVDAAPMPVASKSTLTSPKVVVEDAKDKKLYDMALAALKDNRFEVAEEKFNNFITTYPKSSLQSNAYFWYGETFFRRNIFDKAAINYLKGYKQFPKGAKAADSLLKLVLTLGELKKKTEACSMLTKLEAEFPDRPAASIKRAKDAKVKFGCK